MVERSLQGATRRRWTRSAAIGVAIAAAGLAVVSPTPAGAATPSADLSVAVSHTPPGGVTGDRFTFTVAVHNDGPDAAEGVIAGLGFTYPLQVAEMPSTCRHAANYASVVCDLGGLGSGADATVQIQIQAFGSGLYTLPAAVTSTTADPDLTDQTATDTLLVKAGPTRGERYVRGIVPIVLDRPADSRTVNYWAPRFNAESQRYPSHLEKIPAGLINSNEYRRLRIREAYTRILGRAVDPSSLSYWVAKSGSGWSYERIERNLLTSREFLAKRDLRGIITDTYQAVYGRPPTSAERSRWTAELQPNDFVTFPDFVTFLQRSTEGYDVLIERAFQDTLGHAPTPLARYVWQVRFRQGQSAEQQWARLLVSNEVLAKYPYTQDDYPGGPYGVPVADVRASLTAR